MYPRVVEIANDNRYLSLYRGFMKISSDGREIGRVPIADIGTLVLNAHGLSYSQDLLVALANAKIPAVVCGKNKAPIAWLWPNDANHIQASRMDAQLAVSEPAKKRIWQAIIKKKIEFQADLLRHLQLPNEPLSVLVNKVRSGDPGNIEAQAARRYWKLLFGQSFRRDREANGINALLNYGYTIVRSAFARSIMSAGLHPTPSINHKNRYNAFRLVDDLMEPYRVLVDWRVHYYNSNGLDELTPETKKFLVDVLYQPVATPDGNMPMLNSTYRVATSLARVFSGGSEKLWLPEALVFDDEQIYEDTEWLSVDVDSIDV